MTTPLLNLPDTTAALWDRLYMVRLPRLEVASVEYLRTYGTYVTGQPEVDQWAANHLITTMRPIHELAEYHRQHVRIYLVQVNDAVEIHQAVQAHLEAWERKLRYGLNNGNAPLDDLMALEAFARTVYYHAKHRMPPESTASLFLQSISNPLKITPMNFFKTPPATTSPDGVTRIHAEPDTTSPTDHLGDFLRHHIGSLNIRRPIHGA